MSTTIVLTAGQKQFLAHACTFVATSPPHDELEKLLTLAIMLRPAPAAEMLAKRAASGSPCTDDAVNHRLQ